LVGDKIITAMVDWIDIDPPYIIAMSYTPATRTSGMVSISFTTNESIYQPNGRSGASTGITFTKIFNTNTGFVLEFSDLPGNIGSTGIIIDWIDKIPPICGTWSYSPMILTNQDVIATLTGSTDNESGIATSGGNCTLAENGQTCTVIISDIAGNTTICTSDMVFNIDKSAVTGTVAYNPNTTTS
jgi:hypothetical protein